MNIFKKFIMMLKKINRWYRVTIPGSQSFQVNPLIVITLIGLMTTSWGLGTGIGAEKLGNELSQDLRNSPQNIEALIEDLYEKNQINGSQREIELQKLADMTPIFIQAADVIQDKGQDIGFQAAAQALFETAMNYAPGEALGSLVGASSTGKGLDLLHSIKNITESIEGSSISWTPFSEEEALLVQQIRDVMGTNADALFLARMRTRINLIKRDYIGSLKKDPCNGDQVLADFRAELIGLGWGEGLDIYGEGEKFPTYEAFIDWLIAEGRNIDDQEMNMVMTGDFYMGATTSKSCSVCVPPSISGTVTLTINLETCDIQGTVVGDGAGTAERTQCDVGEGQADTGCTAQGTASVSGSFLGTVDSSGALSIDEGSVLLEASSEWIDGPCEGSGSGSSSMGVSITGSVDWKGSASGNIQLEHPECAIGGEWSANK